MARPITLFTGQWADLPFVDVARLAAGWGYDGLEIACWGDHLDPWRWDDEEYVAGKLALLETFVKERPLPSEGGTLGGVAGEGTGTVTVDDAAVFLGRFTGGALATFEATRFALGRKNAIRIEINGSAGSLAFDFEDMNVLEFFDGSEPAETAGFRRIVVTEPEHPYVEAWWPAGHGLGYEHGFTHQVVDLVTAIAKGDDPAPSFADGLQVQRVLDAVERSAADNSAFTEI